MGIVLEYNKMPNEEELRSRLLIYLYSINDLKTPVSVSKVFAEELLKCSKLRRSLKIEQVFSKILASYPDDVVIRDIDVMFNPEYKVDVLKILIEARKRKKYSVIWPGRFEDGKLIYAEEGYPDYKVYEIANYDITCVR